MGWRVGAVALLLAAVPALGLTASTATNGPAAADETRGAAPGQALGSEVPAERESRPTSEPSPTEPSPTEPSPTEPSPTKPSPTKPSASKAPTRPAPEPPRRLRIPDQGSGRFVTARVSGPVAGAQGRLLRYQVRVEKGLPLAVDPVARRVHQTLSDPRSWAGSGDRRLKLVGPGERADFTVLIATPKTTDRYCLPLRTWGRLSCQSGSRAVLNARRWAFGASTWGADVEGYRTYLINHEVGHVLGRGHERCPKRGARAPVMVQQTKSLQGCRPNAWPSPRR